MKALAYSVGRRPVDGRRVRAGFGRLPAEQLTALRGAT